MENLEQPQATTLDTLGKNKELQFMPKAFEKVCGVFPTPHCPIHLFI